MLLRARPAIVAERPNSSMADNPDTPTGLATSSKRSAPMEAKHNLFSVGSPLIK